MNITKTPCLAIIVKSQVPDAIGKIVEVQKYAGNVFYPTFGTLPAWIIQFKNPQKGIRGTIGRTLCCPDFALRPVSGLSDPEFIDTEQPIDESVTA